MLKFCFKKFSKQMGKKSLGNVSGFNKAEAQQSMGHT